MKHLLNISAYPFDIQRHGGERGLSEMCQLHRLDGMEVLTGYFQPPSSLRILTKGVHLPYAVDWHSIWTGDDEYAGIRDEDYLFLSYGRDRDEIVNTIRNSWMQAKALSPDYGVFHAGSPRLDRIFSQDFSCSDKDVLDSLIEILNAVAGSFPEGEPPFPIMLENLWWPGLRFMHGGEYQTLVDGLKFQKWGFCLDVGHLMNSLRVCKTEGQAIEAVLGKLGSLPQDMLDRVRVIHLHLSLSGQYQEDSMARGEPEDFLASDVNGRLEKAFPHFSAIDWHAPFQDGRCREIVRMVDPDYVTHEFICPHAEDMDKKLRSQLSHFQNNHGTESRRIASNAEEGSIKD